MQHALVSLAHIEVRCRKAQVIDCVRLHHERRLHRGLAGATGVQDPRAPAEALALRVVELDGADWRALLFDDGMRLLILNGPSKLRDCFVVARLGLRVQTP